MTLLDSERDNDVVLWSYGGEEVEVVLSTDKPL
jgi:hypothetical protein